MLISQTREGYRELARSEVLAAWPQILEGLIEKAVGGGYQHTKLLLDLCELAAKERDSEKHPNEQLCDALLNNLQLRPREWTKEPWRHTLSYQLRGQKWKRQGSDSSDQ
jgi:hypothetical protein